MQGAATAAFGTPPFPDGVSSEFDPAIAATWTPAGLASLFPDLLEFFYLCMDRADSFRLNTHLGVRLAAKIVELCDLDQADGTCLWVWVWVCHGALVCSPCVSIDGRGPTDFSRTYAARLLKLKLLAKFLGVLTFSPHW